MPRLTSSVVAAGSLAGLDQPVLEGEGIALRPWPQARGRRLAHRAVAAVTAWSFEVLGLHRIEISHSTQNQASCRVAERAGYRAEGVKRSVALHADGWHDMHLHARIATDPA